jgi:uncharacterized protein YndB with AHSA1/START domain
MPEHLVAKTDILIHASAAQVWKALTDPALIKQYLHGTDTKTDWVVGSPITFSGEWQGKSYVDKGQILENQHETLLQFTHWSSLSGLPDLPENYYIVTFHLLSEDGGTRLTVTQDPVPNEKAREGSEKSWNGVLATMKKILEG